MKSWMTEDVKEELIRCFSNTPTTIQAIEKLRGMKQRPGENAILYAARYEVIHFRANQLIAEQQNQPGEMMFYAGTLQDQLRRKSTQENTFHQKTPIGI